MRVRTYIAVAFLSLAVTTKLRAQPMSLKLPKRQQDPQGTNTLKVPQDPAKTKSPAPVKVYGQVRLEGMQYLTALPEAPQLTYSQLLSARLSAVKETSWVDMAADISGGTFFSRGQSHYVVHEAYLASRGKELKVTLGRKKKDFSELDNRWQLGLWQPKFAIDTLRPEEQGLSGAFVDYRREKLELVAFATPLFIPSMGPDIKEEGGGLVSDSRWYRTPSRDYDFNDRINNISYKLDIPDTAKLVNNGGVAGMARLGRKETGPWLVASAGYLPVNELIYHRKNFKVIDEDKVDVTVSPKVTHHYINSADIGYTFGNLKTSVSYLEDRPQVKKPDDGWAIQKLEPIQAYSVAADFTLHEVFERSLAFQLSYLKVNGGGITDILSNGQPDDFTLFDQRLKFTDAVAFKVEGQLASIMRRPLVTRFKYLYDYDQKGSLLNTEFLYYPNQKWAVLMGADVLGVQDESYKTSSFLNQYRANDRVYGGMTYVF